MKINITRAVIINLIFVILACGFVIFRQCNIIQSNELIYGTELEQQQIGYLDGLNKFVENYNDLQADLNELSWKYHKLAAEKGFYDGWEDYQVTGYTSLDAGCNAYSSIGINILKWNKYFNFCAVDPKLIPYGSIVLVKFDTGIKGFLAADCGGKIRGKHIDLYFSNDLKRAFRMNEELEVKILR